MTAALPPEVAALKVRPYAPESAVERVARALYEANADATRVVGPAPWGGSIVEGVGLGDDYYRLAVAALTAMRPAPDAPRPPDPGAALARVEELCGTWAAESLAAGARADAMPRTDENVRHYTAERRHARVAHHHAIELRGAIEGQP